MGITGNQGSLRLRRVRVEHGVDWIGEGCLQARVLLEAVPHRVASIDRVVQPQHQQILAVAVGERHLPLIRAAAAAEYVAA